MVFEGNNTLFSSKLTKIWPIMQQLTFRLVAGFYARGTSHPYF